MPSMLHPNRRAIALAPGQMSPAKGFVNAAMLASMVWAALAWALTLLP